MHVRFETASIGFTTARGEDARVSARVYGAAGSARGTWLLLGHGAGAGQDSPFMVSMAGAMSERGIDVVTFNFLYAEKGHRPPDPKPTLIACYTAALESARRLAGDAPLFIGGKSMGGRIASEVAAARNMTGMGVAGLVFLGYPLHVPGRSEELRTGHWPLIHVPSLFVQGSRDPFAPPDELRAALPDLGAPSTLLMVEGGGHSLGTGKAAEREAGAVPADVEDAMAGWMTTRAAHFRT